MVIKERTNLITYLIIFALSLSLISCCVIEELVFNVTTLPDAVLNQEYKVIITASVKNNPEDDTFDYEFKLTGTLPNGLIFTKDEENRRVIISGTPLEQGSFEVTLQGKVSEPYDPDEYSDDLLEVILIDIPREAAEDIACSSRYEHEQRYTLNVAIM